tara:strand:- start:1131 stop:1334 length:204 start_codon:yes stop_codon:yes gene_type:complete
LLKILLKKQRAQGKLKSNWQLAYSIDFHSKTDNKKYSHFLKTSGKVNQEDFVKRFKFLSSHPSLPDW